MKLHKTSITLSILFFVSSLFGQNSGRIVKQKIVQMATELAQSFEEQEVKYEKIIAITEFNSIGKEAEELKIGETVPEFLNHVFRRVLNFTVVERRNIKKVLDEMALEQSGLTTTESVADFGRMLGAEYMVVGSVGRMGDIFHIVSRLIENASGQVIATASSEIEAHHLITVSSRLYNPRKNKVLAALLSIIPGGGHFFNGKPVKGIIYLTTFTAMMTASIVFENKSEDAYIDYKQNTRSMVGRYGDASKYYKWSRYMNYGAIGILAWNMLDAYWDAGAIDRKVNKAKQKARISIQNIKKTQDMELCFRKRKADMSFRDYLLNEQVIHSIEGM
jgi:TolB-like protein